MKKAIKFIVSLFAVLAAVAGIIAGIKLFIKKLGGKKAESEEFTFEGDDLDDANFLDEDAEILEAADETPEESEE